jgi:putative membrane protein
MMGDMGGMMGSGWMLGMMAINALIGLAFVALLIVGVVVGIRWLATSGKTPGGASPPDRALTLARERYAKGEISREEFERLRLDLS